jgi:cytochrome c biogenesis factor
MAPEIGYFALLLSFLVSITQSAMPFVAARRRDLAVVAFVDQAALVQFMLIVVAFNSHTGVEAFNDDTQQRDRIVAAAKILGLNQ